MLLNLKILIVLNCMLNKSNNKTLNNCDDDLYELCDIINIHIKIYNQLDNKILIIKIKMSMMKLKYKLKNNI